MKQLFPAFFPPYLHHTGFSLFNDPVHLAEWKREKRISDVNHRMECTVHPRYNRSFVPKVHCSREGCCVSSQPFFPPLRSACLPEAFCAINFTLCMSTTALRFLVRFQLLFLVSTLFTRGLCISSQLFFPFFFLLPSAIETLRRQPLLFLYECIPPTVI